MQQKPSLVHRLAIIPARGGSKRIPRKNVRRFHGKPMIGHILEAAASSGLFQKIHVSTEDSEISDVVSQLGFRPTFPRPATLADDRTPLMPVLKHVSETFAASGEFFDQIWLLMACAPLITAADLLQADALFQSHAGRSPVLAVAKFPVPVEWAYERDRDGRLVPLHPDEIAKPSQGFTEKYFDTGTFAVFPAAYVLNADGAICDLPFVGYPLPASRAVDIDTEEDWALAEALYAVANR